MRSVEDRITAEAWWEMQFLSGSFQVEFTLVAPVYDNSVDPSF